MEEPTIEKKHSPTPFFIIGAILFVLLLAGGTALVLKFTRTNQSAPTTAAVEANANYDKAQESLVKGDLSTAKSSFEKAKTYFKQNNDSSKLKEIDAALSLIEHSKAQPTEPPKNQSAAAKPQ